MNQTEGGVFHYLWGYFNIAIVLGLLRKATGCTGG